MIRQDPHIFFGCQLLLFQCLKVAPSFCSYCSSPLPLSESLSSFPWNYLRNIKKHETFNFKAWSFSPNILSYLASMILIVSGTECSCLGRAPRSLVTSEHTKHCQNWQQLTTTIHLLRTTHQICSPELTFSLCCNSPPSWLVQSQAPDPSLSECLGSSLWSPPLCRTASAETSSGL